MEYLDKKEKIEKIAELMKAQNLAKEKIDKLKESKSLKITMKIGVNFMVLELLDNLN